MSRSANPLSGPIGAHAFARQGSHETWIIHLGSRSTMRKIGENRTIHVTNLLLPIDYEVHPSIALVEIAWHSSKILVLDGCSTIKFEGHHIARWGILKLHSFCLQGKVRAKTTICVFLKLWVAGCSLCSVGASDLWNLLATFQLEGGLQDQSITIHASAFVPPALVLAKLTPCHVLDKVVISCKVLLSL